MTTLPRLLAAAIATVAIGGCFARSGLYGQAYVTTPDLVYVEPGVQVVADFDYPVFYASGAYWRYDGGYWYQSRWHDHAWARTTRVPVAVRQVPNPQGYAHYTAGPRDHRVAPPLAREQRSPAIDHRPSPPPVDHRPPARRGPPPTVDHREPTRAPPPAHDDRGRARPKDHR